jgi:hypothetical protein
LRVFGCRARRRALYMSIILNHTWCGVAGLCCNHFKTTAHAPSHAHATQNHMCASGPVQTTLARFFVRPAAHKQYCTHSISYSSDLVAQTTLLKSMSVQAGQGLPKSGARVHFAQINMHCNRQGSLALAPCRALLSRTSPLKIFVTASCRSQAL